MAAHGSPSIINRCSRYHCQYAFAFFVLNSRSHCFFLPSHTAMEPWIRMTADGSQYFQILVYNISCLHGKREVNKDVLKVPGIE